MPKGHSTLEPRIKALEAQIAEMAGYMTGLVQDMTAMRQLQTELLKGSAQVGTQTGFYEPLFTKWPPQSAGLVTMEDEATPDTDKTLIELQVMTAVAEALKRLQPDAQPRVLKWTVGHFVAQSAG